MIKTVTVTMRIDTKRLRAQQDLLANISVQKTHNPEHDLIEGVLGTLAEIADAIDGSRFDTCEECNNAQTHTLCEFCDMALCARCNNAHECITPNDHKTLRLAGE